MKEYIVAVVFIIIFITIFISTCANAQEGWLKNKKTFADISKKEYIRFPVGQSVSMDVKLGDVVAFSRGSTNAKVIVSEINKTNINFLVLEISGSKVKKSEAYNISVFVDRFCEITHPICNEWTLTYSLEIKLISISGEIAKINVTQKAKT